MANRSYAKMILNTLNNNDFAFKMQHKVSFCVKKCCILLPFPFLSQAGEALLSRYYFLVSPHWGETEGRTGKFAMRIINMIHYTINQVIENFNFSKYAKRCKKMQLLNRFFTSFRMTKNLRALRLCEKISSSDQVIRAGTLHPSSGGHFPFLFPNTQYPILTTIIILLSQPNE
jgi:hypothetical protein